MANVYNWADDENDSEPSPAGQRTYYPTQEELRQEWQEERLARRDRRAAEEQERLRESTVPRPSRHTHKEKTHNINVGFKASAGGSGGGRGGRGGDRDDGGRDGGGGGGERHQGDRLIYAIERIEFRSDRDILALAKAINHLGRELHLILGMRAEELNGVLSTYKGKWYTFGASSRVKARLVSAHLKVSAEAAKALGVGSLKMAHAFNRHFVQPEREARQKRNGTRPGRSFTIGDE
ncbi:hypothetical protein [Streptomyces sp. 130]|uniref:hypothetical protein n=1 Tax=Streptomyces sp. 130 TaxID=2591006 RepID=UPI00163DA795|nr:hypothetical protein [Streptomyces sp. 130]